MEKIPRENKIVAFIPLREGSKRIPLKNIKEIAGKPLACWVIEAALNCSLIDQVFVSTDSDRIKNIIGEIKNGKLKIIKRSKKTATDNASTESAMLEFSQKCFFNHIVLIQATSPLLTTKDIDKGIKKYFKNRCDSLLSVVRQKRFIWKEGRSKVEPVNYTPLNRPFSQDFKGFLVENGAFYITSRERLLKMKCRISGKICAQEMPEKAYFEIDDISDWDIVENLLKGRKKEEKNKDLKKRSRKIKMFISDVDGVLTDGGMYYSESGEFLKKFNTRDGMGIELMKKNKIIPVFITKENSEIVLKRAKKLGIKEVFTGINDKVKIVERLLKKYRLTWDQIASLGDDVNDLLVLRKSGLSLAPKDAIDEVKGQVDCVVNKKGGEGVLRESLSLILNLKNK